MSDLNRVTLIGRLTRDPEIRHTASGDSIASIRLAVNTRKKVGDSWDDVPGFYEVTIFGRQAATVEQFLSKGRRIGVDGRLSWREWEAKDGSKRQTTEIVAQDVFFLDSREDAPAKAKPAPHDDDSLPF